jgi:hypothetical protein
LQNAELKNVENYKTSKITKKVGKTIKAWFRYKVRNLLTLPPVQ